MDKSGDPQLRLPDRTHNKIEAHDLPSDQHQTTTITDQLLSKTPLLQDATLAMHRTLPMSFATTVEDLVTMPDNVLMPITPKIIVETLTAPTMRTMLQETNVPTS